MLLGEFLEPSTSLTLAPVKTPAASTLVGSEGRLETLKLKARSLALVRVCTTRLFELSRNVATDSTSSQPVRFTFIRCPNYFRGVLSFFPFIQRGMTAYRILLGREIALSKVTTKRRLRKSSLVCDVDFNTDA